MALAATASAALTRAEFAAKLAGIGRFERRPFIAVAVSGGPDSLALAFLADDWARQRGGSYVALTVDHRLRLESSSEAELVGHWLAGRGLRHEILVWSGAKPATGIQEAARSARYALLSAWCRAHGCLHLFTAHHREDQAETYLLRRGAGSGPDGLAAMPAVRELAGCRLLRPLLGVPKARLIALLEAERHPYLIDPSNRNPRFERARWRCKDGDGSAISGIEPLLEQVRRYGEERTARQREVDALLAGSVALHPAGFAVIDPTRALAAPSEIGERLFARVARVVGGGRYPVRRERVARLHAALRDQPVRARTLGGCHFVPWRSRLLVMRETSAAATPAGLQPGERMRWDNRFEAMLPSEAARSVMLAYLGAAGVAELDRSAPNMPAPRCPACFVRFCRHFGMIKDYGPFPLSAICGMPPLCRRFWLLGLSCR